MMEPQHSQCGPYDFFTAAPFKMEDLRKAISVARKDPPDGDIVVQNESVTEKKSRMEFILDELNSAYRSWLWEARYRQYWHRKSKKEVRQSLNRIVKNTAKLSQELDKFALEVKEPEDARLGYSRSGYIYLTRAEAESTGYNVGDSLALFGELATGVEDTTPDLVARRIREMIAALEAAAKRAQEDSTAPLDPNPLGNPPYERFLFRTAHAWQVVFEQRPPPGGYYDGDHPVERTRGPFLDFVHECLLYLEENGALDGLLESVPQPETLRQHLREIVAELPPPPNELRPR